MHPSGIKFGLVRDLLEFRGADVIVTNPVLEGISEAARLQVQENDQVNGTEIWEEVVGDGLGSILPSVQAPHKETTPFFMGLDNVVFATLMPLAEKAGMGRRIGKEFLIERGFWDEFSQRINKLNVSRDMTEVRGLFFRECCNAVRALCTGHDPDNVRHADLLALWIFNDLNRSGALPILEQMRTAKPRAHRN